MRNEVKLDGTWQLAAFNEGATDWSQAAAPYPIEAKGGARQSAGWLNT